MVTVQLELDPDLTSPGKALQAVQRAAKDHRGRCGDWVHMEELKGVMDDGGWKSDTYPLWE